MKFQRLLKKMLGRKFRQIWIILTPKNEVFEIDELLSPSQKGLNHSFQKELKDLNFL